MVYFLVEKLFRFRISQKERHYGMTALEVKMDYVSLCFFLIRTHAHPFELT